MFVGDEVRADVSPAVAGARLASLISGGLLVQASHEAWGHGIARVGPVPGLSRLVRVRFRAPVQRGAVTRLTLRWEATGITGRMFPVLDADLTLAPDGEDATLLGLDGVYRPPGGVLGAGLDRVILHRIAVATVRSFLTRLAEGIAGPAAPAAAEFRELAADPEAPANGVTPGPA